MTRNRTWRAVLVSRTRAREGMDVWAGLLAMENWKFYGLYVLTLIFALSLFSQAFAAGIFVTLVQTIIFGKAFLWR